MSDPDAHGVPQNRYNPHAWIVGDPEVGEGCWIGAFTVVDGSGGLTIGAGTEISSGAQIYTHTTVGRVLSERQLGIERAPVVIEDHVHVGANAVILMGSHIGHHSVIAAGAVVTQFTQVPPWSVVAGVPGRIFKGRARDLVQSNRKSNVSSEHGR